MEDFKFDYDVDNDDLFVYLEGKKSAGAVELGNFVLDFDKNTKLVALQITNVSEVFEKLLSGVSLNSLKEVKIDIVDFRNMDMIKMSASSGENLETANILIPHIKEKSPVLNF